MTTPPTALLRGNALDLLDGLREHLGSGNTGDAPALVWALRLTPTGDLDDHRALEDRFDEDLALLAPRGVVVVVMETTGAWHASARSVLDDTCDYIAERARTTYGIEASVVGIGGADLDPGRLATAVSDYLRRPVLIGETVALDISDLGAGGIRSAVHAALL